MCVFLFCFSSVRLSALKMGAIETDKESRILSDRIGTVGVGGCRVIGVSNRMSDDGEEKKREDDEGARMEACMVKHR